MAYLIFDQNGELLDILNFDSDKEVDLFKKENPDIIIKNEEDFMDEDDFFDDDEYSDEW